jgi:hypothetical protein
MGRMSESDPEQRPDGEAPHQQDPRLDKTLHDYPGGTPGQAATEGAEEQGTRPSRERSDRG